MKKRNGFVSNSSSSSFIINTKNLNVLQIYQIDNHIEESRRSKYGKYDFGFNVDEDAWTVDHLYGPGLHDDAKIRVSTFMDNFDMAEFLKAIGVPNDAWEDEDHPW